jgi:pyruvate kinase
MGNMLEQQRFTIDQLHRSVQIERSIQAIQHLICEAKSLEATFQKELQCIAPDRRESANNLIHYLSLRRHDFRDLQHDLILLGLSSLGRSEAHVLNSLTTVLSVLYQMKGEIQPDLASESSVTHEIGRELLSKNTVAALGPKPEQRSTRIMVTMPSRAADDPALIRELLANGMDIMRINCAHDNAEVWRRMIFYLRQAEQDLGRTCKVSFDLAGPKLRTGPIAPGPEIFKWHPTRNPLGQVITPAILDLTIDTDNEPTANQLSITLSHNLQVGDILLLLDTRERARKLKVVEVNTNHYRCECDRTGYVTSGIPFDILRNNKKIGEGKIGKLPPTPQSIPLSVGDELHILHGDICGEPATLNQSGEVIKPAYIGCNLPEVFQDVQPGERIFFDDGKFEGKIRSVSATKLTVDIVSSTSPVTKLKSEKGINLPDSHLKVAALTDKDLQDLEFVTHHGDLVALSFVKSPADIEQLICELERLNAGHLGVILKIETNQGFMQLPKLLLTALQRSPVAVMVARGDLGVEVGFERLSEVQEEILWLCEAAHVPVIWATQVLESVIKGGIPSRSEVTDAAAGSRAECVMLNKGSQVEKAMHVLDNILCRMQENYEKKTATLRKLHVSELQEP